MMTTLEMNTQQEQENKSIIKMTLNPAEEGTTYLAVGEEEVMRRVLPFTEEVLDKEGHRWIKLLTEQS